MAVGTDEVLFIGGVARFPEEEDLGMFGAGTEEEL